MEVSRRDLLAGLGASLASGGLASACGSGDGGDDAGATPAAAVAFAHGVASGDPLRDRVLLWTRVTRTDGLAGPVQVVWEVSTSEDFSTLAASGVAVTAAARDFTVKADASGLDAGTTYWFRFIVGAAVSPLGRTRTAAAPGEGHGASFAVVSCASLAHGYFHVYRDISELERIDAVLHLGDYIYEYPSGAFGSVRAYDPLHQLDTLDDYRRRHAQYKSDADLQAMHLRHPMIAIWDDHEFANNAWVGGAENQHPSDGPWATRKAAAMQAYFEWMPVREQPGGRIWRSFSFGDVADLMMLDTRIWARPQQADGDGPELRDPHRSLLGDVQEQWLYQTLGASQARWKLVGQQIRLGRLASKFNTDSWDGYPAARDRLLGAITSMGVEGVAVLSGDIHSSWAFDLPRDPFDASAYDPATGRGSAAVELIVPGVTAPGAPIDAEANVPGLYASNPHLRYADTSLRGFVLLRCQHDHLDASWFHLADGSVEQAARQRTSRTVTLSVRSGSAHLVTVPHRDLPPLGSTCDLPPRPVGEHPRP